MGYAFPLVPVPNRFMSHRRRWSEDHVEATGRGVRAQTSLVVLWNAVLSSDRIKDAWQNGSGKRLKDVLGLPEKSFPVVVLDAEYVDVRFVGVPLVPGICPSDRVFECFGIALVLIKHTDWIEETSMCQPADHKTQRGCHKAMAMRVSGAHPRDLCDLPPKVALGLWELSSGSFAPMYLQALAQAASLHETYLRDFAIKKQHSVEEF